ncbi:hypothetical protein PH5382_02627 [Phaeobacter sp. CECT 5382]|nr:hypothetical protein PH5382_02627 [Phaeobacter sp. CECT 5382]
MGVHAEDWGSAPAATRLPRNISRKMKEGGAHV